MNMFSTSKDPKMVTSNSEEFTFPIVPNPLASFMLSSSSSSSSSLWRISSRVFHHQEEEEEEVGKEGEGEGEGGGGGGGEGDCRMEVRSTCDEYSSMNKGEIEWASCQGEELEMEERMDCLWEDFNEEEKKKKNGDGVIRSSEVHLAKESCVLPRQQPRMSGRPSKMVVMGRLLKGLVSIRKSAQQKILKAGF